MACWIVHGKRVELDSNAVRFYNDAGVNIQPCPPPARKGRPSPRTGTTGAGIGKYGTQQLKYVDDDPSKGVIEKDVGARTRLFFGGEATTPKTPFSARYQAQRPATIRTTAQLATSPHAIPQFPDLGNIGFPDLGFPDLFGGGNGNGNGGCVEDNPLCGFTELMGGEKCKCPNWFGWEDIGKERGCECEACKNGTGQCSDKVPQCDAWDLLCEGSGGATVGVVGGTNYFFWIKIVLAVIGIGILLWLLRPLFGIVKNVSGVIKK